MIYFDVCYILRLYLEDPGWESVRRLATQSAVACSLHGQAEVIAGFHRKFREGAVTRNVFNHLLDQFEADCNNHAYRWLPVSPAVIDRVANISRKLPASIFLRGSDALHLTSASEHQFREIYSNDGRLLAASGYFAMKGVNIF